ncbi:MAG: hypothetical protein US53_C0031G0001, partial [Candidatus Woesebacteria bacterium GW2011_GWA1_37_7]
MAYQEGHLVRPSQSRKELDILVKSRPEGVSMRTLMDLEIKNYTTHSNSLYTAKVLAAAASQV